VLWSFMYLSARNLFALVSQCAEPVRTRPVFARLSRSNELKNLVLSQLRVRRRQAARPKLTRANRALMTALSCSLPRAAWAGFR
jgi:hypothetical protein